MPKIKLILLSMVAVLAVYAVAVATASAAEEETCGSGPVVALCFELAGGVLSEAPKGTYPFTAKNDAGTKAEILVAGIKLHINCTVTAATGNFVQPAELTADVSGSNIVLSYTGCTVPEPAGCTIPGGEIKTNAQTLEWPELTSPLKVKFLPPASGIFYTLKINGEECVQKGNFNVTGSQEAVWDNGNDSITHLLTAGPTTGFTFGGKPFTEYLSEVTIELTSKKSYDFNVV